LFREYISNNNPANTPAPTPTAPQSNGGSTSSASTNSSTGVSTSKDTNNVNAGSGSTNTVTPPSAIPLQTVVLNGYEIGYITEKNGVLYGSVIDMMIAVGGTHFTNPYTTAASFSAKVMLGNGRYIEFHFTQNGMFVYYVDDYGDETLESKSRDYIAYTRAGTNWLGYGYGASTYDYAVSIDYFVGLMNKYGGQGTADLRMVYTEIDDAALAWYDKYLNDSIGDGLEYGAWIYSIDVKTPFTNKVTTKYFYDDLVNSLPDSQPTTVTLKNPNPKYKLEAWLHTHGNKGIPGIAHDWTYWNFSWGDMAYSIGYVAKNYSLIPGYVGNVKGEIFRMDTSITDLYNKYPPEKYPESEYIMPWQNWHGSSATSTNSIFRNEALGTYVFQIR